MSVNYSLKYKSINQSIHFWLDKSGCINGIYLLNIIYKYFIIVLIIK